MTIALARFGSFYAGGRQVRIAGEPARRIAFTATASFDYDPNGLYHVEQAYVQFFIPAAARCLPLVLLHGGGMSGAMWEHTPDGRPGWVQALVAQGVPVYVVDNVERGRAGWTPFASVWPDAPIVRSAEEAWTLFRIGAAEGFATRRAFDGQRFPAARFDRFIQGAVPRWLSHNDVAVDSLAAVIEQVGPCMLLAHSQGGEVAFRAAMRDPARVRGVVAVEPSGFAQAGTLAAAADRDFLFVYGDHLDATPLWQRLRTQGGEWRAALAAHGGRVTHWDLPALGIQGNSHMPMMDDNSDEIAARIAAWVVQHAPA